MSDEFLTAFRNVARGGLSYREIRHQIFLTAQRHGLDADYDLLNFLRDRLLKLRKGGWFALAFDDKDWRALDVIRGERTGYWTRLYLPLVLDYVSANADRVRTLAGQSLAIGTAMLNDDGPAAQALLARMPVEDEQSLFAFRVQSAQFSFDAEGAIALLRAKLKTDWLRKRYLYPLVYQAFATPSQDGVDDFLSFVITGEEPESERATLRFLLRDDLVPGESLAFKCYVALLCHPFDAFEILLNHVEEEFCSKGALSTELLGVLARLHREVPSTRTSYLTRLAVQGGVPFSTGIDRDRLGGEYGLDARVVGLLAEFADVAPRSDWSSDGDRPKPLAALMRMRARKYPIPDDFNYLVNSGRSWWFCEGGRLLNALMTSLYMLPRGDVANERRDLLRLIGFFGAFTPFLLTAPSVGELRRNEFSALRGGRDLAMFEEEAEPHVLPPGDYDDRMWIKAVHWSLREPERKLQIGEWLSIVRREIRIAPAFLTGVDWSWLEKVIKASRLRPFVGDPSGLYALLLFKIEERDRRSGALRTAIEPLVDSKSLPEVVDWLVGEYGGEAIAFARFLLQVDDLLWLGLAPNRTAALAGRIYALERCIRQFNYTDLLPETLFGQEWETLNSALLLLSVNAGQFEIPWSVFIRDAAAKQHDLYTAAHSLEPADATAALLASSRVNMPYRFRNERVVTYAYPHRLAPVVALIIAVVEDFLAHPAFGLEMILSTRFRHDTMRREFAAVLESVAEMSMPQVWPDEQRDLIERLEKPILATVDDWLDARMHTVRPGKPQAFFDVIPTPDQMTTLAEGLQVSNGVDRVISDIVDWIRGRLDEQLPVARRTFEAEMPARLQERVASEKARLLEAKEHRAGSVDRVLGAVHTALVRRASELVEWFKGDPEEARSPLTFGEVKAAADGLFEAYKDRRAYRTVLTDPAGIGRQVASEKVRPIFDLLREIFASALDHTEPYRARVRMRPWRTGGLEGFVFSNLTLSDAPISDVKVAGDPYASLNDVIFREGESGLAKIAAIAATVVGCSTEIRAVRRGRSFHLFIPLWRN